MSFQSPYKYLKSSSGIDLMDMVCIKRDYVKIQGTVGQVVDIVHNEPYMAKVCTMKPKDVKVEKLASGGARIKMNTNVPEKQCTLQLFPASTRFAIDFSGKGERGHGSIQLPRKDIEKVPQDTKIASISKKCLK